MLQNSAFVYIFCLRMSGYFTETNVSVAFEVCFILKRKKRQKYKKSHK